MRVLFWIEQIVFWGGHVSNIKFFVSVNLFKESNSSHYGIETEA